MGFLLKHTWVLQLREERGCGESFGKNASGSAGPYWTVWWTQNTARVNFSSLMDNTQPMTTHKPRNTTDPNKCGHAPARFSVCDKNKMAHSTPWNRITCIPQASSWLGPWAWWRCPPHSPPSWGLGLCHSLLQGIKKWCFGVLICLPFLFATSLC